MDLVLIISSVILLLDVCLSVEACIHTCAYLCFLSLAAFHAKQTIKYNGFDSKMADKRVVLSDSLCFLKSKFGKTATKSLRVALLDFYSGEELSVAKQQLLEDISVMKSSVKFPHVPRRRDGDDKATRVTDDIILLFTCIDENKLIDQLPRYVSDNPDALPSISLL